MSKTLTTLQFWLLSITVALALIMVLFSISLFLSNRSVQGEVNSRQQYINDSIKINRLSNQLIQSLANLSAQTSDDKLKDLLSAHGIQFSEKSLYLPTEESK